MSLNTDEQHSDMNHYFKFVQTLRNSNLLLYFKAFRELSQIYLIDPSDAKELATIIADAGRFQAVDDILDRHRRAVVEGHASDAKELATIIADAGRFQGIWRVEEVYEFAERRADWYQVKRDVERAMYGIGCTVM